uniref:Protein JTB n=1 Tax=Pelusios castaneus TaxID=367368 RepID=A0A8C8RG86_9SAUR
MCGGAWPRKGASLQGGEGPDPASGGGGRDPQRGRGCPWATPPGRLRPALPVVHRAPSLWPRVSLLPEELPPRTVRRGQDGGAAWGDGALRAGPGMGPSALLAALGALVWSVRPAQGTASSEAKRSVSPVVATLCWQVEDFVVVQECAQCMAFQTKTIPECSTTGFIEQIKCVTSKKEEYKSCRSAATEAHSFWKFEGAMICVAVVFALLVMCRQRVLDRKAREKVRKQMESI